MSKTTNESNDFKAFLIAVTVLFVIFLVMECSEKLKITNRTSLSAKPKIETLIITNLVTKIVTNVEWHPMGWRVVQTRDKKYHLEVARWERLKVDFELNYNNALWLRDHELKKTEDSEQLPPPSTVSVSNGMVDAIEVMRAYSNIVNWVPDYVVIHVPVGETN